MLKKRAQGQSADRTDEILVARTVRKYMSQTNCNLLNHPQSRSFSMRPTNDQYLQVRQDSGNGTSGCCPADFTCALTRNQCGKDGKKIPLLEIKKNSEVLWKCEPEPVSCPDTRLSGIHRDGFISLVIHKLSPLRYPHPYSEPAYGACIDVSFLLHSTILNNILRS